MRGGGHIPGYRTTRRISFGIAGGSADAEARQLTGAAADGAAESEGALRKLARDPALVVGRDVERRGILRHGAKFLHNISCATVPKVTVVLRKAYGAGYHVMGGRQYGTD